MPATGGSATGGTVTGGNEPASGGDPVPPKPTLSCADDVLDMQVQASTTGAGDDFSGSCGAGNSPDVAYEWVAPMADWYRLDTIGSDFDTVLYLQSDCGATELACSDNTGGETYSSLVRHFETGERVLAVVDGKVGTSGSATLNVNPVTCPAQELTGQPLPVQLSTAGGPDVHTGSCSTQGFPERSYRWTPPSDGLYRFSARSDAFSPAIYLERGPSCGGLALACNRGTQGGYRAEVTRRLTGGEPVTVIVDSNGGAGLFDLDIQPVTGATCPSHDWSQWTSMPVIKPGDPNILSASCAPAGGMTFSGLEGYSDHSYHETVDLAPGGGCGLTILSSVPFNLFVLRGADCGGEEVMCAVATDDGNGGYSARWNYTDKDNGDYTLVVESPQMFDLSYDLRIQCVL